MDNIIDFPGRTTLDIDVNKVLDAAREKLKSVVLVGFTHDGNEYFSSSIGDSMEVLWLLERAKHYIISQEE